MRSLQCFSLAVLLAFSLGRPCPAAQSESKVKTTDELVKIIYDAKVLDPGYKVNLAVSAQAVLVSAYVNNEVKDLEKDCKIDAVLIARSMMEADKSVARVKVRFYNSFQTKYYEVAVTAGDIIAFGSKSISQEKFLNSLEVQAVDVSPPAGTAIASAGTPLAGVTGAAAGGTTPSSTPPGASGSAVSTASIASTASTNSTAVPGVAAAAASPGSSNTTSSTSSSTTSPTSTTSGARAGAAKAAFSPSYNHFQNSEIGFYYPRTWTQAAKPSELFTAEDEVRVAQFVCPGVSTLGKVVLSKFPAESGPSKAARDSKMLQRFRYQIVGINTIRVGGGKVPLTSLAATTQGIFGPFFFKRAYLESTKYMYTFTLDGPLADSKVLDRDFAVFLTTMHAGKR